MFIERIDVFIHIQKNARWLEIPRGELTDESNLLETGKIDTASKTVTN